MLCDEDGVAAHGSLAAVVARLRGGKARLDEPPRMLQDRRQPPLRQIGGVGRPEPEAAAEGGAAERREKVVEVAHRHPQAVSARVDEHDLGVVEGPNLDPLLAGDGDAVARFGADAVHLHRTVHRHEIDVA